MSSQCSSCAERRRNDGEIRGCRDSRRVLEVVSVQVRNGGFAVVRRAVDLSRLLSSEAVTQTRLADHSGVILDLDSLHVYSVNDTGMCLVEALRDGVEDHEGLVRRLVEEFDVEPEEAASDVDAFVEELARYLVDRRG